MKQPFIHQRLKNGMTVVVETMEGVQSAAFTFLVPAGAIYDAEDREGAVTLLSELVLRGAGPRDSRQLVTALDNLGVERAEGVGSAHTSFSGATLAENLPAALEIYADVVRRPHLPAEQLEAARSLALQELAGVEDEPRQKVMLELRRRHYPRPWGRSTLGTAEGLNCVTQDDLVREFRQLYRPRGTILGVAGKVDATAVVELVERLFGDWEADGEAAVTSGPSGPRHDHVTQETTQTQIGIAYPSVVYGHADYYRAWAAVGVLSGGMSARLFTEVREKRGLCYACYATHHTLKDYASVMCYAGTTTERAQETLDVTLAELRRLEAGIAGEEIARVKARMKSALIMQQESSSSRSASVAKDWYHLGRVVPLEEVHDEIEHLTPDGVLEHVRGHPARDFTIVTLGPEPLKAPAA